MGLQMHECIILLRIIRVFSHQWQIVIEQAIKTMLIFHCFVVADLFHHYKYKYRYNG